MKMLVLAAGLLALSAWGGPDLVAGLDAVAGGVWMLAAGLGVVALGLVLLWVIPLPAPRRPGEASPPVTPAAEQPLGVPVACYRPDGDVAWLWGELVPRPGR
jgi:hypothetical protein